MSGNHTRKQRHVVLQDEKQEQLFKFAIGLRLLGEQKRERYLAYLFSLQEKSTENRELPEK